MRLAVATLIAFGLLSCARIDEPDGRVESLVGGGTLLCAAKAGGQVLCRGRLTSCVGDVCRGRFVYDTPAEREIFVGQPIVAVVSSGTHACARTSGGELWCWGGGMAVPIDSPSEPHRIATRARVVGAGVSNSSTCVLYDGGEVECWGDNEFGQLGDGTTTSRREPRVVAVPRARSLSVEGDHACVLTEASQVWCWGRNFSGMAVPGAARVLSTPARVPEADGATMVSVGVAQTCAIVDFRVICWGSALWGLDGSGVATEGSFGPWVLPFPRVVTNVVAEYTRTIVTFSDGTMTGWGGNYYADLGIGSAEMVAAPTQIASSTPSSMALTENGGCWMRDGRVECWGFSHRGAITGRTASKSDFDTDGDGSRKESALLHRPTPIAW